MIAKLLKVVSIMLLFFSGQTVLAASIHHFELIADPLKVSVGEAIDLTIEAVDKDGNTVDDYDGSILIISESDRDAEFPQFDENGYTFSKSDQGIKKFENAVKFKKKGKNDIHVYDLSDQTDSVIGLVEIEVAEEEVIANVDIDITSPQDGITVGTKEITVSGTSKKNHQIRLTLNNKDEILTTTDRDGNFEKVVEGLPDGKSVIKAFVLNSENEVIGESREVNISSDLSKPSFNKIVLNPSGELKPQTNVSVEVYATQGLTGVSLIVDSDIVKLTEGEDGIYTGEFLSPKTAGEYSIDVEMKNELGNKTIEKKAETMTVAAGEEKTKDVCKKGDYSGSVFDGKCGEKPVDFNAPTDLGIKNLKIVTLKTKSILTWDNLEDAEMYEVHKKTKGGELELLDTIKENKYEIPIVGEEIKYEYFAVKAIAKKEFSDTKNPDEKIVKEIQGDISDAVKVQTGPKEVILVVLALILGLLIFLFSKRKA